VSHEDGGDSELLNGGRAIIAAKFNVLQHSRVKARVTERTNGVNLDRTLLSDFNALNSAQVR
jgi:hypothetical protein